MRGEDTDGMPGTHVNFPNAAIAAEFSRCENSAGVIAGEGKRASDLISRQGVAALDAALVALVVLAAPKPSP
jgi:hypothetical protein